MRLVGFHQCSTSGVPLVIDRFGTTTPLGAGRIRDPLSAPRGLAIGLAVAVPLWTIGAALLGVI